jgi:hypothetical protein
MAIIYSYPEATIESTDFLLGTKINESGHPTKSFLVSDLITLVQSNIPTPTLNEVLTAGNTSQIDANIGILGLYDSFNGPYSYITGDKNRINFYSDLSTRLGYFGDNTISFDNNGFQISIKGPDTLTANRTIKFPDAAGTVALNTAANGSFTSNDGKTITVVNGIITAIV